MDQDRKKTIAVVHPHSKLSSDGGAEELLTQIPDLMEDVLQALELSSEMFTDQLPANAHSIELQFQIREMMRTGEEMLRLGALAQRAAQQAELDG